MHAGRHAYRRACVPGHAHNASQTVGHLRNADARDPFTRLGLLRCFRTTLCSPPRQTSLDEESLKHCHGQNVICGSTTGSSIPPVRRSGASFPTSSSCRLARPYLPVFQPSRQLSSIKVQDQGAGAHVSVAEPDATCDANEEEVSGEPFYSQSRTREDTGEASGGSHEASEQSQAGSLERFKSPGASWRPARSIMVDPPPFEDDGLKLEQWDKYMPRAEQQRTKWTNIKRIAEQKRRVNLSFPRHWEDLFEMVRHYTPRRGVHRQSVGLAQPSSNPESREPGLSLRSDNNPVATGMPDVEDVASEAPDAFEEYLRLRAFIDSEVPEIQPGPRGHVPQLTQKIKQYFDSLVPDTPSSIGLALTNSAIQFLISHKELPYAKGLLTRLRSLGLKPDLSTLNAFLHMAATEQNIHAAEKYVKMILAAGFTPDHQTWIALLSAAPSADAKRKAIQEMGRKGLLTNPNAHSGIIPLMLPYSLGSHLDAGKTMDEYVDTLVMIYGRKWLSTGAVNGVLDTLASRGLSDDALRFLYSLQGSCGFKPNVSQLHTLMGHHKRMRDLPRAIRTCVRFEALFGLPAKKSACDFIFSLAWSLHYYNVAKVAWKYACAEALPKYKMRSCVVQSILEAHSESPPQSRQAIWMRKAGYMVCNTAPSVEDRHTIADGALPDWLYGELYLAKHVKLVETFSKTLVEAWHRDQDWLKDNIRQEKSVVWMLEKSVTIPTVPLLDQGNGPAAELNASFAADNKWRMAKKLRRAHRQAGLLDAIDNDQGQGSRDDKVRAVYQREVKQHGRRVARYWATQERSRLETTAELAHVFLEKDAGRAKQGEKE